MIFLNTTIQEQLSQNVVVQEILKKGDHVGNLYPMEEALVEVSAFLQDHKTRIIVKKNRFEAQQLFSRIEPLTKDVLLFVMEESLRVSAIASSPEDTQAFVSSLTSLVLDSKPRLIICNVAAFLRFLPDVQRFQSSCQIIKPDMELDMDSLKETLVKAGYSRVNYVDRPCTFASRGGIIDIFPLPYEHPVRIEFFDTIVDSIRLFDEINQRTIQTIDQVKITPASHILFSEDQIVEVKDKVKQKLDLEKKRLSDEDFEELENHIEEDLYALESYDTDAHLYWYYSYTSTASLLDYVSGTVIISSIEEVEKAIKDIQTDTIAFIQEMVQENRCLPQYQMFHTWKDQHYVHFHEFLDYKEPMVSNIFPIEKATQPLPAIIENISIPHIYFAVEKDNVIKIQSELVNSSFSYKFINPIFYEGFQYQDFAVYTEKELFIQPIQRRRYKKTFKDGQIIDSVMELQKGDYVVHEQYGIGQYLGIETKNVRGQNLDYLHVIYAGNDDLYVPLSQFQLVRKYVSKEGVGIHLSKLGSDKWSKTKQKVNERVQAIAKQLVALYAVRNENIGYAFSEDDALQKEFEDHFPYEPTPDQIQATEEIKAEMEKSKPMDHLLCGDVGFGKTEVAMRCAFKAICNGKQVAFLCPTTILSMQHYQTVSERFAYTGANVALVNRFVSDKEVKKIKKDLEAGTIDIIIGTHRLLNKSFKYKDLGLLIIDEEQRFGVVHKEKIKEMKQSIDVLSLSATPIPRTLQMSLIGVRTISQLNTPPAQRHPIQTYVIEKRGSVIKEIIQRELARNGQVFYLYNNISNIYGVAENLRLLFPDHQIAVAHGRMSREEIEQTMLEFEQRKYDILVCTTIIETGLDIANANTMIIENADHFGLSQLYQIRGRVGRRDQIAYCYLMVQPHKKLTEEATKRLKSIKEFTQLGSGYKIAMRDLTIRGAGDLLGPQQAGFIDQVGLDLYLDMLSNAIKEQKGKVVEKEPEKIANIQMNGYIPKQFTDNDGDKLSLYQEIKKVKTFDDLEACERKVNDLYGRIPKSVQKLFERRKIDLFVNEPGVDTLVEKDRFMLLTMTKDWSNHCNGVKLFETMTTLNRKVQLHYKNGKIEIQIPKGRNPYELLMKIIKELQTNGEIYEA